MEGNEWKAMLPAARAAPGLFPVAEWRPGGSTAELPRKDWILGGIGTTRLR
jgi:hypothetical protein